MYEKKTTEILSLTIVRNAQLGFKERILNEFLQENRRIGWGSLRTFTKQIYLVDCKRIKKI